MSNSRAEITEYQRLGYHKHECDLMHTYWEQFQMFKEGKFESFEPQAILHSFMHKTFSCKSNSFDYKKSREATLFLKHFALPICKQYEQRHKDLLLNKAHSNSICPLCKNTLQHSVA